MDIEVSTEDPKNDFNEEEEETKAKEFDKMSGFDESGEGLCLNDDIIYLMVSHILVMGIAISSGYHESHFAIGKHLTSVISEINAIFIIEFWILDFTCLQLVKLVLKLKL